MIWGEMILNLNIQSLKCILQANKPAKLVKSYENLSKTLVASHLKEIDSSKATGPDGIPPVLLKEMNRELSHSLHAIFKKIQQTCVYPKI